MLTKLVARASKSGGEDGVPSNLPSILLPGENCITLMCVSQSRSIYLYKWADPLSPPILFPSPSFSPSPPILFPSPPSFSYSGVVKGGELLSISITFIQPLSPSPPILFPSLSHSGVVKGGELLSMSVTFIQPLSPSPPILFPSPPSFSHSGVVKGCELLSISITFIQPSIISVVIVSVLYIWLPPCTVVH